MATLGVFHFGPDRATLSGGLASGVLWVTLLFASILGINRLFVSEFENSDMEGVLLAPVDRTAIYVAKGLALLIFLVILEIVTVPVFALFFLERIGDDGCTGNDCAVVGRFVTVNQNIGLLAGTFDDDSYNRFVRLVAD